MNKTCSDCIHDKVCDMWAVESGMPFVNADTCEHYQDKSRYIELPCAVGQTIYDISEFMGETYAPEIYELRANEITIEKERNGKIVFVYDGLYIYPDKIGKTHFLTKEDAEKALKGGTE